MAKPPNLKQTDPSYAAWMKKSERVREMHTARAALSSGALLSSLPSRCARRHVWHPGSLEWIQSTERSYADLLRSLARSRRIKRPSTDLAIPGPRLLICPCELHTHRADGATHVYCVVHLDGRCVVLRFLSMPKRKGTAKTEKASAAAGRRRLEEVQRRLTIPVVARARTRRVRRMRRFHAKLRRLLLLWPVLVSWRRACLG